MEYLTPSDIANLQKVAREEGYESLIGKVSPSRLITQIMFDMLAGKDLSAFSVDLIEELAKKIE